MTTTATNLIQGPATVWSGVFGATEPADTTAALTTDPATGWVDLGATVDGTKLVIKQEYKQLEADQLIDTPGSRLTKRETTLETSMAEPTLANLQFALNGGTIVVGATTAVGTTSFEPISSLAATQPVYGAVILDGWAPGGAWKRRVIVRKVLSVEGVETEYKKDGQTLFKVTFMAHYVSSSIRPFKILDQTA